jgi:hypothetical protein
MFMIRYSGEYPLWWKSLGADVGIVGIKIKEQLLSRTVGAYHSETGGKVICAIASIKFIGW